MEINRKIKEILLDTIELYNLCIPSGVRKISLSEKITDSKIVVTLYGEKRIWKEERVLDTAYPDFITKDFWHDQVLKECYSSILYHLITYAFKGEYEPKIKINDRTGKEA